MRIDNANQIVFFIDGIPFHAGDGTRAVIQIPPMGSDASHGLE
jgi:hypothetical protein